MGTATVSATTCKVQPRQLCATESAVSVFDIAVTHGEDLLALMERLARRETALWPIPATTTGRSVILKDGVPQPVFAIDATTYLAVLHLGLRSVALRIV